MTDMRGKVWVYGAILLFCGMPLLLLGLAITEVIDGFEAGDEAARQQSTFKQIVSQMSRHQARSLTPTDIASFYLASLNGSLASAELQDRARKLVMQAGGRIAEVQGVGAPDQDVAGEVTIRLALAIDNNGLRDLLYGIETSLPLLDVTDLNVTRDDGQSGGDNADGQTIGNSLLRVELTVRGHWRKSTG